MISGLSSNTSGVEFFTMLVSTSLSNGSLGFGPDMSHFLLSPERQISFKKFSDIYNETIKASETETNKSTGQRKKAGLFSTMFRSSSTSKAMKVSDLELMCACAVYNVELEDVVEHVEGSVRGEIHFKIPKDIRMKFLNKLVDVIIPVIQKFDI